MLGRLRRAFSQQTQPPPSAAVEDIEQTMLRAFDLLSDASEDPELLTRRFKAIAALASLMGALRDAYPGLLIEEQSLARGLIEANAAYRYEFADMFLNAIMDGVRDCPAERQARINSVLYTIAPKGAMKAAKAAAN